MHRNPRFWNLWKLVCCLPLAKRNTSCLWKALCCGGARVCGPPASLTVTVDGSLTVSRLWGPEAMTCHHTSGLLLFPPLETIGLCGLASPHKWKFWKDLPDPRWWKAKCLNWKRKGCGDSHSPCKMSCGSERWGACPAQTPPFGGNPALAASSWFCPTTWVLLGFEKRL